ncbi:GMC family oxidoreductase [Povalibacter sp.]|uniref:GMC family oxidoreductase n=1 Tax=Povalibacter sp. TaxID=1962978 RepID=UPI002F42808D
MTAKKYRDSELIDFAIVGSGAAGGVIARELAQAGLDVVLFEQGSRLSPADFEHDELKYWFLGGITNDAEKNPQTFRTAPTHRAEPQPLKPPLWYGRTVGGSTVHYTANYWRFHEIDFIERSVLGAIPGTGFDDWPITYADLEPYYTKVDWEIGVSGLAGASPFDPPRTRPYPMPPLPVKSSGVLFERGARKLGLHPFPAPMCINSQPYNDRAACVHCGFCHGFACEALAKASTLTTVIPQAEATGHCEVRPQSYVMRIETDKRGRTTGVAYFDHTGRERFQKSRAVVVCANGAETPRLLLLSANAKFPQGLGNSSGAVGKYLMFNYASRALGVFEHELNEYKSVQVTRILHDFYASDPKRGQYGGGGLDARIGPQPMVWAQRTATEGPAWGSAYKARLREFPRSMQVACHGTSLPLESNNVTLDPELKDAWGMPAIRTTYKDHPDDLANARFLQDRGAEILEAAGAQRVTKSPVTEQRFSMHLLGTCRMGNAPAKSVVDKYHRSHDVPNLFICDGSSLVTSGRGQPTMTIQALAFRAGEHIARFAKSGEI